MFFQKDSISCVIPVYNEEKSLKTLCQRLKKTLSGSFFKWEIIFVLNGCTDQSNSIALSLSKDSRISLISLRRPSKSRALTAGFKKAKYGYVATLDADLQDRPEEIVGLFKFLKNKKLDCVVGWRQKRQDLWFKKAISGFYNYICRKTTDLEIHDFNSGLKIFRKEITIRLIIYGEMHRFILLIIDNWGYKIGELAVKHELRQYGHSKYSGSRIFRSFFDFLSILFINRYLESPLRFFGPLAMVFFFLGLLINIYLSIIWFQGESIGRRPLLTLGILLILVGVQLFSIGFLGDLFIYLLNKKGNNH